MELQEMELYKEIFIWALAKGEIKVTFSGVDKTVSKVIEGRCYQALQRIKAIIQDDSLEDPECFQKIEEVVCELESIGSSGGGRHDFG